MSTADGHDRILIADDDPDLLALLGFTIRNAGFDVVTARDGTSALSALATERFALMVLDINMPGADGFAVCQSLRVRSTMPVIMLSARSEEADIVRALEVGADDYLTKPFSPRTLLAHMRAILRRSQQTPAALVVAGNVALDVESHMLRCESTQVALTPLETAILRLLFLRPGRVVRVDDILTEAWGAAGGRERNALKQVVYRLRRKLEERTVFAHRLQTSRSAGYRWADAD